MIALSPPLIIASARDMRTLDPQILFGFVAEASQRFSVPEAWILAVIDTESRRNPTALSAKGALGLMQLMPATWQSRRASLALGSDPFDPHDNILAGTAYLRALFDRYGAAGFLAAYNAGPGRYEDWLKSAKPLPAETMAYVATLSAKLQIGGALPAQLPPLKHSLIWTASAIFVPEAQSPASQPNRHPTSVVPSPFVDLHDSARSSILPTAALKNDP